MSQRRDRGDCVVVVRHGNGEAIFGPLFYNHDDPRLNVYVFLDNVRRDGYKAEFYALQSTSEKRWELFKEASPPGGTP